MLKLIIIPIRMPLVFQLSLRRGIVFRLLSLSFLSPGVTAQPQVMLECVCGSSTGVVVKGTSRNVTWRCDATLVPFSLLSWW